MVALKVLIFAYIKMRLTITLILLVHLLFLSSCSSLKELVYFQEKKAVIPTSNVPNSQVPVHIIAPGDMINLIINTPLQSSATILNSKEGAAGYQVKGDSTLEIPVLGNIKIAGLPMNAAKDTILNRAKIYYNEPSINLQLVSFKVTVLGEVLNPGLKALYMENATFLDAIASSGDLTSFGNRTNIKVIRGSKVFYLNLTELEIMKSEGYYLQSNDIVYVQPLRRKNTISNLSTALAFTSFASVITTLTTTIILLTKK